MKKRDLINIFKLELYSMDFFINIVKKGNNKYFSVKDPFLFGVFLSLLTCGWALKRWNLKKYKLKDYKEFLIDFCFNGIRVQKEVGKG
jgi:hypothetical protein